MKKNNYYILAIFIFGVLLRFYNNTSISLWHDEAFSALFLKYSWSEVLYRIGLDVHPPMYYIFLRFWYYIFGDSLIALRSFSVFFGSLTIVAVWAFIKSAFKNEKAALIAAVLIAVNPFQLQYVTEARMYTFGAFFVVLAAYFLTKALHEQKEFFSDRSMNMPNLPKDISLHKHYVWHYLGFAISVSIIILTHYYLLFTATALCFYALIFHFRSYKFEFKKYIELFLTYLVIIFSFLPWLKVFLYQYKQVQAGYWIEKANIWSVPSTIWQMLLGIGIDISKINTKYSVLAALIFSLYFLYRFIKKNSQFEKWLVIFAMLAPFAGSLLFVILARLKGSSSSVYLVRYFLFSSLFFTSALGVWFSEIKYKKIAGILLAVYVTANLWTYADYWKQIANPPRPGMYGAVNYIKSNIQPKDKIFSGTSFMFFNLKYYIKKTNILNPVKLYTGGRSSVKEMSHVEGSAILADFDLAANMSDTVVVGDNVWLVWTEAFGSNKPSIPNNWSEVSEKKFLEVRPYPWATVNITEYKVN